MPIPKPDRREPLVFAELRTAPAPVTRTFLVVSLALHSLATILFLTLLR
jgi:hypothetical protein